MRSNWLHVDEMSEFKTKMCKWRWERNVADVVGSEWKKYTWNKGRWRSRTYSRKIDTAARYEWIHENKTWFRIHQKIEREFRGI